MNRAELAGAGSVSGLGHRFWRLAVSAGASNLADGVFKLALPLAAITFTRSPTLVAGLELVRSLPWLLFALPVGALAATRVLGSGTEEQFAARLVEISGFGPRSMSTVP